MTQGRGLLCGLLAVLFLLSAVLALQNQPFSWEVDLVSRLRLSAAWLPGSLLRAVSWLGAGLVPYVTVPALALYLRRRGLSRQAIILLFGVASASLTNFLFKVAIERPRPGGLLFPPAYDLRTPGFPSGHVLFFTTCYGYLCLVSCRYLTGVLKAAVVATLGFLILAVGLSRIWLGVHWPLDCIGGYLLGGLFVAVMGGFERHSPPFNGSGRNQSDESGHI